MSNKSSPKSFGKSASLPPYVGEYTLSLRMLAVTCTMRNEALRSVTEHYGTLRDVMGRYGRVADRYETLRVCYGALTERYGTVMENTDFAHQ